MRENRGGPAEVCAVRVYEMLTPSEALPCVRAVCVEERGRERENKEEKM